MRKKVEIEATVCDSCGCTVGEFNRSCDFCGADMCSLCQATIWLTEDTPDGWISYESYICRKHLTDSLLTSMGRQIRG